MTRGLAAVVLTLCCLAGCSSTAAVPVDPMVTTAQQCTRGGGWWRTNLGICDTQGTGVQR